MKGQSIEKINYTNSEYRNTGAMNHHINDEENHGVKEENHKLQQKVSALTERLKTVEDESQRQYGEMLEAVSGLAKKVHAVTDGHSGHSQIAEQRTDENVKTTVTAEALRSAINVLTDDFTDLDLKFQLHENSTQDGHLIWKINDFENRTHDAVIGKVRALHSAPCYTEKYGYKYCLRLYLHGDGMGRGTHLSLFIVIMKSEYDDILQWPFQKKIKFKLINQKNRSKDHVEQMFPDKDSSSFQQPKKEMNIASGCPLFISLDRLEPEGFLRNGNLFIEVNIE